MSVILTQTIIFTLIVILILWLYSILINDVSIIDTAFAPLVLFITLVSIHFSNSSLAHKSIIFSIVCIWSMRLTLLMLKKRYLDWHEILIKAVKDIDNYPPKVLGKRLGLSNSNFFRYVLSFKS